MAAEHDVRETQSAETTSQERRYWNRAWDLLIHPTDGPAPAPPKLTVLTVAMIAGLLIAWRAAILIGSIAWARLGVDRPWPADEYHHLLSRYSVRWDSGWYLGVIQNGYFYDPDSQSSIAFYPLFPFATRYLETFLPSGPVLAGLVLVHLSLFGAMLYIYQLVRIDYPDVVAWRSLLFLLIFPAGFFLSAFYAESLLLFGMAATLYHARRGQWLLAGIFGCFTGLTKLIGVIVVIPVVLELIRQKAISLQNPLPLIGAALVPVGAIGYLGYLHAWLGDFRVYFWNQEHWNRNSFDPEPFVMFARFLAGETPEHLPYPGDILPIHNLFFLIDMGSLLIFLVAGVYLWLRVNPGYGALVLAGAMIPALSGTPLALARYMAVLFPVFILAGTIKSEPVRNAIVIASVLGLGLKTYLFVNGYWAG